MGHDHQIKDQHQKVHEKRRKLSDQSLGYGIVCILPVCQISTSSSGEKVQWKLKQVTHIGSIGLYGQLPGRTDDQDLMDCRRDQLKKDDSGKTVQDSRIPGGSLSA